MDMSTVILYHKTPNLFTIHVTSNSAVKLSTVKRHLGPNETEAGVGGAELHGVVEKVRAPLECDGLGAAAAARSLGWQKHARGLIKNAVLFVLFVFYY